jgi:hypothetical protein
MNEGVIRSLISLYVIGQIQDGSIQSVIRQIIFDDNNIIDWDKALTILKEQMPEMISVIENLKCA